MLLLNQKTGKGLDSLEVNASLGKLLCPKTLQLYPHFVFVLRLRKWLLLTATEEDFVYLLRLFFYGVPPTIFTSYCYMENIENLFQKGAK
uniref:Uncharacterized protein n=1 Tax=Arundo donax TaxID=35708 RepID=A0A0A9FI43_ARUDO